ncbi:MAG: low-specificity L-threonine aldolase [Chloroflexi bacterium]|nr:low-specificity L-threonine aldolase [Chloroflexota bacterium]
MIDLRRDTLTLPSPEMRAAMATADVGDDVYGEDPTANRLEAMAAELLGKEAGLFVSSGTQGNLVAHLAHTHAGEEVITAEPYHSFSSEAGGTARVAGLSTRCVPLVGPGLDPARVEAAIRPDNPHYPRPSLIAVEQPWSGYVVPLDNLAAIAAIGRRHGIPVHMDGARIFTAAAALGVPARQVAGYADSVQFCLSKGLAAPVGSLVVGSADVIHRARRARKLLGGGTRQAGVLAAAGIYALEHNVERLTDDHANAQRLAAGLRRLPGVRLDRDTVEMNIFFFDLVTDALTAAEFTAALKREGILVSTPYGSGRRMRLVTHYGIERDDIEQALAAFERVLAGVPAAVSP